MKDAIRIIILMTFVLVSCQGDKLDVDVSSIDYEPEFYRFDQRLFQATSSADLIDINKALIEDGGELYEFYVYDALRSGSVYADSINEYLWYFVQDSMMQLLYADIQQEFSDIEDVQNQFIDMFKHQKYHLPNEKTPAAFYMYNSAFSYGVISTDSVMGIGLDMYLGPENRIVKEVRFPLYMKEKMHKDYLPVDVAHSWLITNVIGEDRGETFLSSMIYFGKLRYVMEAMLPDLPEHQIIRYSQEEYEFALASEYEIWQYIVDMNWIYSIDMKVKLRYFKEAPETVGIDGSPGRIGQFMGWQMVRSFMEQNNELTVEDLINHTTETEILKAYKPEKNE